MNVSPWTRTQRRLSAVTLVAAAAVAALVGLGSFAGAEPLGPDVINSPDTTGSVGQYTSLVLDAAGNPVISYYDGTNGDLKVLRCTNPDCSGIQTPQSPDTAGNVGRDTSLVLDAAGNPVISYYASSSGDLKVLRCTNPDCSGIQTPQSPDTVGNVGFDTSIVLDADDNPVISYYTFSGGDLKVLRCTNADCSGIQTPQSPDTVGDVGQYTSIVLDTAGNPVISYYDFTGNNLKVLHCTNPNCSGTQTPQSPDTVGDVGLFGSIVLDVNGNPVISYYDATGDDLKVLHCTNPNCSGTQTSQSPDTVGIVGRDTSIALDTAGNPVISYYDTTNNHLRLLRCTNPNCSGTQTPQSPDTGGDVGQDTSLALDAYGNPVVSYYDVTSRNLKVLHCYDPDGCGGQDQDLDGVTHVADNCPAVANADQANNDGDSEGDVCDSDDDNDNVADTADNCRVDANADQADVDGDGTGDVCDPADGRVPAVCVGFANANVIIGTAAAETLTGTSGRDVILGLGGDDILIGRGGDDCILGGPGDDVIRGKSGNDVIRGQRGDDIIRGGSGADNIRGGSGNDNIRGQKGGDIIRGGSGNDNIRGQSGADTIRGQRGADTIRGGSSADTIFGNSGDDTIFGNRGNDIINGGRGFDRCNGGPGADTKTRCES